LVSEYVFIDTEAYVRCGFDFSGSVLGKLVEFAQAGMLRVLVTDVKRFEKFHKVGAIAEILTHASVSKEVHRTLANQLRANGDLDKGLVEEIKGRRAETSGASRSYMPGPISAEGYVTHVEINEIDGVNVIDAKRGGVPFICRLWRSQLVPRRKSLKTIEVQIRRLQAEAERLKKEEKPGIKELRAVIARFKLKPADFQIAVKRAGRGPTRGSKLAPKYRNPKDKIQTWAGRGHRPRCHDARDRSGRLESSDGKVDDQVGRPDAALVKAISRAHDWLGRFERGEVASYHELARAEGFTPGYVRSVMQLAFLAPPLVEAFLDGRRRLRGGVVELLNDSLPLSWQQQHASV
jgi:DNA-binding protein H-NS